MADLRKSEQPVSWLETELARQLAPVSAPDSLWFRIHEQRRPLRVRRRPVAKWFIMSAALFALLACLTWRLSADRDPAGNLQALAIRELRGMANGSAEMDIQSGDIREIQHWVKTKLNLDVPLAGHPVADRGLLQLFGARIIPFGSSSAAVITFRAGRGIAAMLVAVPRAGFGGIAGAAHSMLRVRASGDTLVYSWKMGADDYAFAFRAREQSRLPCGICHAPPAALTVFR